MTRQRICGATAIFFVTVALSGVGCRGEDEGEEGEVRAATGPHRVLVEIDRMAGTLPVQVAQNVGGRNVSLVDIYDPAAVELRVIEDRVDLPRQETLRLADLHGLMMANNSVPPEPDEWKVHVLVVTADEDDPNTLGIMFDFAAQDANDKPREAFAVFETPHHQLTTGAAPEMLLTTAHELAHVFNLHHTDWEGKSFQDSSSVEGYSLTNSVLWKLSDRSIAHLRSHALREVQPGSGGVAFGVIQQSHLDSHQSDPVESYDIADPDEIDASRRAVGERRVARTRSRLSRDLARVLPSTHPLRLRLHSTKESYVLGEPVVLTVELHNEGDAAQDVIPLLEPEYGFLALHVREPGESTYHPYRPPVLKEGRGSTHRSLPRRDAIYAEAKVFFGADGWTFNKPGEYMVLADFPATDSPGSERVVSDSLRILITEPTTPAARRAVELLRVPDGSRLAPQQGLFLYLGGGDHLTQGKRALEQIVVEAPAAPHTAATRLVLGHAALRPTLDPRRRVAPEPRVEDARRYLAEIENEALPPLSLMRIQGELIQELEEQGRDAEAARLRGELMQTMEAAPAIRQMDRPEIRRRIQ